MKVIYNNKKNCIKFSELMPGDTFIDPHNPDCSPEMKLDYGDIFFEFAEVGERKEKGFASVSLETGNVFFYTRDDEVMPIRLKAVEG